MGKVFCPGRIKSRWGILFQLPVWLVAIFGLYKIGEVFYYSFTEYDVIKSPSFVGFQNFSKIFLFDETTPKCLGNTVTMVCVVSALLIITAVLPALFTARLKLPIGLSIMGAFCLVSICAMRTGIFRVIFSSDSYGYINNILLSNGVIDEPINFLKEYSMLFSIIAMWLVCLAPVFSITYIAVRMKHSFLGAAIAVCIIPVLMYGNGHITTGIVGYPSVNYSADWIYTIFNDFAFVRYEVGYAYSILAVGLLMLVMWCLTVCSVVYGFSVICKNINTKSTVFKVLGYVTFGFSILLFIGVMYFALAHFFRAFKPLDELLLFPHKFFPQNATLKNFTVLPELFGNLSVPFSRYVCDSLVIIPMFIIPVCLFVALPAGFGLGAYKTIKKERILLLFFIPFLAVAGHFTMSEFDLLDTYYVYMIEFISSFEFFVAVFLVYLVVKLVFYDRNVRIGSILLGIFCIASSFVAIGVIRGISGMSTGIYSEEMKSWSMGSSYISYGGIARSGSAAANDLLMVLATIGFAIIPLALLLTLYLLYRKNTKNIQNEI